MSEQEPGFEIKRPEAQKGQFYPLATSFRLGDTVLIERVTGLEWPEFAARIPDPADIVPELQEAEDVVVMVGLMAASIWQALPNWRRDKVVRYVEAIELEHISFVGGDSDEDDDARPPDEAEASPPGGSTSSISPPPSSPSSSSDSDEPSPTTSGDPTSPTSSPDLQSEA